MFERIAHLALQRAGEPPEIIGAMLYLASEASAYTTGSILRVDGGNPWKMSCGGAGRSPALG